MISPSEGDPLISYLRRQVRKPTEFLALLAIIGTLVGACGWIFSTIHSVEDPSANPRLWPSAEPYGVLRVGVLSSMAIVFLATVSIVPGIMVSCIVPKMERRKRDFSVRFFGALFFVMFARECVLVGIGSAFRASIGDVLFMTVAIFAAPVVAIAACREERRKDAGMWTYAFATAAVFYGAVVFFADPGAMLMAGHLGSLMALFVTFLIMATGTIANFAVLDRQWTYALVLAVSAVMLSLLTNMRDFCTILFRALHMS